jgi:hypothetical protein
VKDKGSGTGNSCGWNSVAEKGGNAKENALKVMPNVARAVVRLSFKSIVEKPKTATRRWRKIQTEKRGACHPR